MMRGANPMMMTQPNRLSFLPHIYQQNGYFQRMFLVHSEFTISPQGSRLFSASLASIYDENEPLRGYRGTYLVNDFPENVYPTYRSIPLKVKGLLVIISSLWTSSKGNLRFLLLNHAIRDKGILIQVIVRFSVSLLLLTLAVQDLFFYPTRLDTSTIIKMRMFPSRLSRFSHIQTTIKPEMLGVEHECVPMQDIAVHYLEYDKITTADDKYDILHFNHGFGASSLSWIPVIPSLVENLRGKKGIAHDSPGFGFTDRHGKHGALDLIPLSSAGSAALGMSLLKQQMKYDGKTLQDISSKKSNQVALFGHSMGCVVSLKMAVALPQNIKVDVILVAPALIGDIPMKVTDDRRFKNPLSFLKRQPVFVSKFITLLRQVFFDPFLRYILKRAVGTRGFWKKGLREVWGNPDLLTDTDVLRFEWPSVCKGWESALLAFTRSRLKATCNYDGGEIKLLSDVLKRPNTSVTIIHGTKDKVIPISMSEAIVREFDNIELIRMDGYGHDPFEEGEKGAKEFCDLVSNRLLRI